MASPLIASGFASAKKAPKPKKYKTGEQGDSHTQVGELAYAAKAPTHAQRLKSMAKEEKLHATMKWVRGEMTTSAHEKVHSRANHVIRGKGKRG